MSDPKDEQSQRAREDAPDSRLAERLLARATQSLGVIDVRHTERQYARVMDWLAGRTPLLEHLRSRYGLTEDERARTLGLAFADAHGAERMDETGGLSAAPGVGGAPAAERLFTSVAHVPEDAPAAPAETRRIRRRGVSTFSPSSSETPSSTRQEAGGDNALEQSSPTSDQTRTLQTPFSVREIPDAPAHGTVQTTRTLSASTSPPDESAPATHVRVAVTAEAETTAPSQRTGKSLTRGVELSPDTGETVSTHANGAEGGREASNANLLRVVESPGAKPSPHARRPAAEPGGAQSAGVMPPEGEPILKRPGPAEGTKAEAQVVEAEAAPTFVAHELGATNASGETRLPLAQAREMLVVGFERDMNTSRAQSTLPLAAGSNNVEHAPATPTLHAPAAGAVPVVSQPSTGGVETFRAGRSRGKTELNVERLTEQVSRHLARRLLIERERRGLGRK